MQLIQNPTGHEKQQPFKVNVLKLPSHVLPLDYH